MLYIPLQACVTSGIMAKLGEKTLQIMTNLFTIMCISHSWNCYGAMSVNFIMKFSAFFHPQMLDWGGQHVRLILITFVLWLNMDFWSYLWKCCESLGLSCLNSLFAQWFFQLACVRNSNSETVYNPFGSHIHFGFYKLTTSSLHRTPLLCTYLLNPSIWHSR